MLSYVGCIDQVHMDFPTICHLFQHNDAPSPSEISTIRESLARREKQASEYDAEINFRQQELQTLTTRRNAVRKIIDAHHALLSPLRQLPTELLSEIFLFTLSNQTNHPHPQNTPLILSAVCKKWRYITLSMPALWTSLELVSDHLKTDEASLTAHWLTLSRDLPLTLRLTWGLGEPMSELESLWNAYFSHIHRWKHIHFEYIALPPTRVLPLVPACGAPLLETCAFHFHRWQEEEIRWANKIVQPATNLREISWNGPSEPLLELPLSNLTKLTLTFEGVPALHLLTICKLAPLLRECNVWVDSVPGNTPHANEPHVVHDALESLQLISHDTMGDMNLSLNLITLPTLKNIAIHSSVEDPWPAEAFTMFLSRSSCSLTHLTITSSTISDADIISLLQHENVHFLVSLDLGGEFFQFVPDTVLDFLELHHDEESPSLPKLEAIAFVVEPSSQTLSFERMVMSRCHLSESGRVARLKAVTAKLLLPAVSDVDVQPVRISTVLQALEENGVKVEATLRYSPTTDFNFRSLFE